MRTLRSIHVVSCHAEGEVGDVIVGGVLPPPGDSLWEQREFLARDGTLWNFLLNEPRGGVFRHCNLLVPPKHPDAQLGFIIMEPAYLPPMSGSNAMCVATVALDTGIIPMTEPVTELTLEAPGGLVKVRADCADGKARRVTVHNLPSFAEKLDQSLRLDDGTIIKVDVAYGGDSFVIVNAAQLGFELESQEAGKLASLGVAITRAANDQLGFSHPELPQWQNISFCLFAGPLSRDNDAGGAMVSARSAVVIEPGKVDRSPTGTAVCARMAVLHARGELQPGERFVARSIINSEFEGRILDTTVVGKLNAILPSVSGRAWITGIHQHCLDPEDPWSEGYRLSDTWPDPVSNCSS